MRLKDQGMFRRDTRSSSRKFGAIFAFWASLLLCGNVYGGAWTPEKGDVYLKLGATFFESFAQFDIAGDSMDPFADFDDQYSRFREESISLYFETGLTDRLAIYGGVIYKDIEQRLKNAFLDIGIENSGFADVELGLRYQLTTGNNVWAVSLLGKFPYLYDDDDSFFQLGNGQEDIEGRVLYGRSLGHGFYLGLEAGYRARTDDPSDEYRYLGELGYSTPKYFYFRTKFDGIKAVDDLVLSQPGSNPLLNPQFDLLNWELTAGVNINKRWHLEYTFSETLSGKNTADGDASQLALVVTL